MEDVQVGAKVLDHNTGRTGVVMDTAKQFAHPQAKPVFNFLVRWQDGQVSAIAEGAFRREHGFELLEDDES